MHGGWAMHGSVAHARAGPAGQMARDDAEVEQLPYTKPEQGVIIESMPS